MKGNIAIIGGGLTGLVASYRLSQKGYKVTVLEKSDSLGGLMGGFKINGTNLEKAYHHIFKTDKNIIKLIKELSLQNRLQWHESSIGIYYQNKVYPFVTPVDLLKFRPLNLIDKVRLGLVKIYLEKDNNYKKFIKIPANEWMKKWCGENAYRVIWEPLLKGKFHGYYHNVSMAWLWARIHTRVNSKEPGDVKEMLGYIDGGFDLITQKLVNKIKEKGGVIKLSSSINRIEQAGDDKIKIIMDGKALIFDKVIASIPSNSLAKLLDLKKYKNYINNLNSIDYLGAVTVIFSSKQSLSPYYWHNINDLKSPFLAFIQHTNLIDKSNYKNEHVYYLGIYLPESYRYFKSKDEDIYKDFFKYLKKIFPKFDEKQITSKFVFRFKNAQHVVDLDYISKIPNYKTPIKNLYLSNFSQIFPEDRGTNFAVREGEKIGKIVLT